MTSSGSITGIDGKVVVDDVKLARVTKWSGNPQVGENVWADSDSEGYENRSRGRKGMTGSMEGKYDQNSEVYDLFEEGDIVELVLWVTIANGDYWALPRALIRDFSMEVDVDTQTPVGWTSNFGSDGKFYRPGQAGAPAHSLPA